MGKKLTLICITIAGLIIIPSIVFNKPIIALIGVVFDFLPLIFGWTKKFLKELSSPLSYSVLVIITYLFFIIWLFGPRLLFARVLFAEIWFMTVITRLDTI